MPPLRLATLFRHRSARLRRALAERFDPVAPRPAAPAARAAGTPLRPAPAATLFRAPRL